MHSALIMTNYTSCWPVDYIPDFINRNNIKMKQTSKDKMITESVLQKTALARKLKQDDALEEAIVQYHRAIFLKEDPVLLG